jgi:MFS family permease
MGEASRLSLDVQHLERKYPEYTKAIEKNYWWNFFAIILDASIYSFSLAMLSQDTIIPYFVSQLTDHKWIVGLVPAVFYFGYFAPQLIGAYIVDGRATKKEKIIKLAIAERLGILAIALVAQYLDLFTNEFALVLLFIAYAIFSITNGMISPGYADLISKNIIKRRGLFYGTIGGVAGIVGFLASYLATYLLNKFSFPTNLRTLFWIGTSVSIISPIIISLFREIPFPEKRIHKTFKEFIKDIPALVKKHLDFQRFMGTRAFIGLGIMANAFYALYAIDKFSLSPSIIGVFTMIILLSQSLSGFIWGGIGDKFGYRVNYIIISGLISVMGVLALTGETIISFYVIAACIGGIYSAISTSDPNMVFQIAPSSETSLFVGISATFIAPTTALAPIIGGLLIDTFSNSFLFITVIGIGILSIVFSILYMPKAEDSAVE